MLKSLLLEELNKRRIEDGKSQIPLSTFYKFLKNLLNSLGIDKNDPYRWLKTKGITVTEKFYIENAKASIQTRFSLRVLKNTSITDFRDFHAIKYFPNRLNKKYSVCLTPDERLFLEGICRKGMHKSRKIRRAQVLLKSDAGLTDEVIANEVNISIPTIERIRKRFCLEELTSALEEKTRSGPPPRVDLRLETEVVALVCSSPPNGYDRWTYELLKREADQKCSKKVSKSTLRSILKKHHLKTWKRRCGAFRT